MNFLQGLKESSFVRHLSVMFESHKAAKEEERAREQRDNTAFLPAVLEVLDAPPNPLGRIVLWSVMAFLGIAAFWASFGEIDVVAVAQGRIVPVGNIKTVQAPDQGVVRAIHVQDGQRVHLGEPLIELDPTVSAAQVDQARNAFQVAEVDRARAQALLDYASGHPHPFKAPDAVDAATVATQQAIVEARINEQRTNREGLAEDREQRRGDRAMVEADVDRIQQQLPLAEEQLAAYQRLAAQGFAPRLRVAEIEQQTIQLRHDLIIRRAELAKDRAAEASAVERLANVDATFRREALDAFNEADSTLRQREQELTIAVDRNNHTTLTAPANGTVQQLQVHTIGQVLKPADPLLVVVPDGTRLVIEANVLNRDAGFVHEGQTVRVKLDAFPFTRYGVINGSLAFLSHDAVQDEHLGLVFPARVELPRSFITVDGRGMPLTAGLAATAEIRTGRRRIIEFLLSPLARRVEEAGRER